MSRLRSQRLRRRQASAFALLGGRNPRPSAPTQQLSARKPRLPGSARGPCGGELQPRAAGLVAALLRARCRGVSGDDRAQLDPARCVRPQENKKQGKGGGNRRRAGRRVTRPQTPRSCAGLWTLGFGLVLLLACGSLCGRMICPSLRDMSLNAYSYGSRTIHRLVRV